MVSDNSYIEYLKKAIEKSVNDEDVLNLIDDGVLNFENLVDKDDQIGSNSEIIYRLSDIKSTNTLEINNLKFPKLSIELSGCSFYKIDMQNSTFYSVAVRFSAVSEISVGNCTVVNELNIWDNKNLEKVNLFSLTASLVRFDSLNNLKAICFSFSKIENLDLKYINILPEGNFSLEKSSIKKLTIFGSKININFNLYFGSNIFVENFKEVTFISSKSTFKSFEINYQRAEVKINNCEILGKLTLGGTYKTAELLKLEIINNKIDNDFFIGKHIVKDQLKIKHNHIQGGFWKFSGFSLDKNCTTEIKGQSFDYAIFQNCDFSNFDFQNTDIHLAEIINPTWKEINIAGQKRIQFKGENDDLKEEALKELKKQYSFFRKKFEKENNYLDASKFKISEALIRTDILKTQNLPRWLLLKFSRGLNLFGESIGRPFKWYIVTLVVFTVVYLLTGFNVGKNEIKYYVELKDFSNLNFPSICEILESFLFSFKNISPVKLEYGFDFSASRPTQIFSMFQKLINLIIVGSLIASMRSLESNINVQSTFRKLKLSKSFKTNQTKINYLWVWITTLGEICNVAASLFKKPKPAFVMRLD